jgi:hypothetical protein
MQEIEVRVSSGIPPVLQLTSQPSPVHTTTHVGNDTHINNTNTSGNHTENTSPDNLRNNDPHIRLDSDGVNSRGSTTGEDSSSTSANDHHGSSSEGGEEFCPMDLSSAGGTCNPRRENMPPSAAAASALIAAAAASKESNSSKINAKTKSLLSTLPSDILSNHPLFNAHKLAELVRAQTENELEENDIKSDLQPRLPKKRAFPELELDLSRMVKERVLKAHDLEPLMASMNERKFSSDFGSSNKNGMFCSDEQIEDDAKRFSQIPPEMTRGKWDLASNKQTIQRRSSSPADSNGSEGTSNSGTSVSGCNAELKKRRLDALLNKKFSSPPSQSGTSPPQRRDSLDASLTATKSRRRKQPHPSSPASSSSSIHSQHSSPPPISSQNIAPATLANNNGVNILKTSSAQSLSSGASLSIRPVAELLSKHSFTSNTSSSSRNKNNMNNNQGRNSNEFATPNKRYRPNNNSSLPPRSSPSPLKIMKPTNDFSSKHLHGLMDIPTGRGSNDLLIPAIRSPRIPSPSKMKELSQKDPHPSDVLKGQILQLQLAQAAILNGASSALPLQSQDFLKMASLLGTGNSINSGVSPSAAANPLLYYGYYAQMLQGVQSQQQKIMEQLSGSNSKLEEHKNNMFQGHPRKRKSNGSNPTSSPLDMRPLSSSPMKSGGKSGPISHRLTSPMSSREFKPDFTVSTFLFRKHCII